MISAPLMVQGIQVNLPEASSEALPVKNNEPLIISIDQEGKIFLETESTKNQSLTLSELNSFVSRIFEASPNMQVVIRGDASVAYQRVMVVMAELQRIASHLLCTGVFGLDLGAFTPFLWALRDRERILDLFELTCGARLLYLSLIHI